MRERGLCCDSSKCPGDYAQLCRACLLVLVAKGVGISFEDMHVCIYDVGALARIVVWLARPFAIEEVAFEGSGSSWRDYRRGRAKCMHDSRFIERPGARECRNTAVVKMDFFPSCRSRWESPNFFPFCYNRRIGRSSWSTSSRLSGRHQVLFDDVALHIRTMPQ